MADQYDRASDVELRDRELAIAQQLATAAKTPKVQPVGYCQNPTCGEEFDAGSERLFCGRACADEHHRRTAA